MAMTARSGRRTRLPVAIARRLAPLRRFVSTGGVLVGLLFFALSLTPSLLPRHFVLQGILSGTILAVGYALGNFLEWLAAYLGLRLPHAVVSRRVRLGLFLLALVLALAFLWFSTGWQNSIRAVMAMPPVESQQPVWVALIALVPALVLIALGTLVVHAVRFVTRRLRRHIPPRVAFVLGILIVAILTNVLVNGVLVRWAINAADRFYAELDTLAGQFEAAPLDPARSGSAASLIDWDTIGLDARIYVEAGPTAEEIAALTGRPAMAPLRTYVGLRSAESVSARAELAYEEMLRIGAFERSVLVLAMPVGTGWVDPPGIDTLEILHNGDVASVAIQYSYLTSWLSLLVEPEIGTETAQALFSIVYHHWTAMPGDERPKLYLYGLSLGAYASQASATLMDVLADPYDGALWVGTPFASPSWRQATANRHASSPVWLPEVDNPEIVRFANQDPAGRLGGPWGPMRLIYLQYPSDPIVFFDPSILYRAPDWLSNGVPPDVSPLLNWYPVVTFFQVALDMALATTSPVGYGHVYAPQDYVDAWVALTDPPGWTANALAALRRSLTRTGEADAITAHWYRASLPGR